MEKLDAYRKKKAINKKHVEWLRGIRRRSAAMQINRIENQFDVDMSGEKDRGNRFVPPNASDGLLKEILKEIQGKPKRPSIDDILAAPLDGSIGIGGTP